MTLGEAGAIKAKIGQQGEWLQVQTASGQAGFVAAWFVQGIDQAFPPSDLVIYPGDELNLRSGPGTGFDIVTSLAMSDPLTVLGDADNALDLLEQWLPRTGPDQRRWLAEDRDFDSVRKHPRYTKLMEQLQPI
jgi:hypothetical protein